MVGSIVNDFIFFNIKSTGDTYACCTVYRKAVYVSLVILSSKSHKIDLGNLDPTDSLVYYMNIQKHLDNSDKPDAQNVSDSSRF